MDQDHQTPSPSIRYRSSRRPKPTLKIPACFRNRRHADSHLHSPITPSDHPPIKKSPSSNNNNFLRSTFKNINDLATLLDCNPGEVTIRRHRRQRGSSTVFAYDPLSYSLNFEQEAVHTHTFMSRLPVTPTGTCNKLEDAVTRFTVEK